MVSIRVKPKNKDGFYAVKVFYNDMFLTSMLMREKELKKFELDKILEGKNE